MINWLRLLQTLITVLMIKKDHHLIQVVVPEIKRLLKRTAVVNIKAIAVKSAAVINRN